MGEPLEGSAEIYRAFDPERGLIHHRLTHHSDLGEDRLGYAHGLLGGVFSELLDTIVCKKWIEIGPYR